MFSAQSHTCTHIYVHITIKKKKIYMPKKTELQEISVYIKKTYFSHGLDRAYEYIVRLYVCVHCVYLCIHIDRMRYCRAKEVLDVLEHINLKFITQ